MLIPSKSSKCSVRLYSTAKQLAEDGLKIADAFLRGDIDKHDIAIIAKGYATLYSKVEDK